MSRTGAFRAHFASLAFDQAFYQGQPQPQPALAPIQTAVRLGERLENMRQLVGTDADAGIADGDLGGGKAVGCRLSAVGKGGLVFNGLMADSRQPTAHPSASLRKL